jgi:nucleoside-diphosphate-sugar epimerase
LFPMTFLRRSLLRPLLGVIDRIPSIFLSRWIQACLDACFTAAALCLSYQLRFDGAIPPQDRATMYRWLLIFPVLRPMLMWLVGVYQIPWRYFAFNDAARLSAGALLSTVVLLIFRFAPNGSPLWASPISVIVMEVAIFLLFAIGARALRRLATEESPFSTDNRTRLILVGSDNALPAALQQIFRHQNLECIGLVVPKCAKRLRGMRINGCPVSGDTAQLDGLLGQLKVDLVMVTDASLDCIGDVVAVACQHQVEVRLLPSAADVIHGNIRIPASSQPSTRIERVLVLGGAGYVGSALVPLLLSRGYKVRVLDRLLFGIEPLDAVLKHPNFELIVGDVRDIQSVVGAVRECDAVIDLAAIVGDPACAINKQLSVEVNRAATRMLIEICKGYGVRRLVFASTCSVYGASDYLVDELTEPAPISIYAETKVASEQLLLEAASSTFDPVILRLGTLFGLSPRPRFDLMVNLLTARAAQMGKITIFNGEQWRPFLHVCDAARALLIALEASSAIVSREVFNVGDYRMNFRLSAVSQMIADLIPSVEIEYIENGDKRNYRASFDKIHSKLGFVCERTLESGILEIYEAIGTHQITDYTDSRFNNHVVTKIFAESDSATVSSVSLLAKLAA